MSGNRNRKTANSKKPNENNTIISNENNIKNRNNTNNTNNTPLKTLVVVDVQNCFITGGSYGGHIQNNMNSTKIAEFKENIYFSLMQTEDIESLIDVNDSIIFTRDFHPQNHSSIAVKNKVKLNYSSTHPSHCLNLNSSCARNANISANLKKKENQTYITIEDYFEKHQNKLPDEIEFDMNEIPEEIKNKKIIGTNISFLNYFTKYGDCILQLVESNTPIGIPSDIDKLQDPNYSIILPTYPLRCENKNFIQLVKGQLCNYESYSAFNYHLKLNLSSNKVNGLAQYVSERIVQDYDDRNNLKNLSTGLFEYILSTDKKNIEITVCGLVAEICVINTVIQGLIMWNRFYKNQQEYKNKKVIFNYSLKGTLFTGAGLGGFEAVKKPEINGLIKNMIELLGDKDMCFPKYRKYIHFNLLNYEAVNIGSFNYNETNSTFEFNEKKNNSRNNSSNNNNNNNK